MNYEADIEFLNEMKLIMGKIQFWMFKLSFLKILKKDKAKWGGKRIFWKNLARNELTND